MFFLIINLMLIMAFVMMLKLDSNNFTFGTLYLLYWWFFCSFAYIIYHKQYIYHPVPFIWIGACVLLVIIGHTVGRHFKIRSSFKSVNRCWKVSGKKIRDIILLFLSLNIVADLFSFAIKGQIGLLLSPNGLLSILDSSEEIRASGGSVGTGNIVIKLLGVAYFFGCILYGFAYDVKEVKKSKILKVLFVVKVVFSVISSAGKFSIIAFIVLFTSGLLTMKMRAGKLKIKDIKYSRLVVYIFIGGSILYFLMNNRAGRSVGLFGLFAYGFGEIPSFNYWFVKGVHESTHGVQCFYGIVSHLIPGINFAEGYSNYLLAPVYPIVNTFTMFRGVISDFGEIGGLLFMLAMGVAAGSSYRKLNTSGFSNGMMAMLLGALLIGFLMPLGYYLTLFLAYIVFIIFTTMYYNKVDGKR